jgi:hypothetical protein
MINNNQTLLYAEAQLRHKAAADQLRNPATANFDHRAETVDLDTYLAAVADLQAAIIDVYKVRVYQIGDAEIAELNRAVYEASQALHLCKLAEQTLTTTPRSWIAKRTKQR